MLNLSCPGTDKIFANEAKIALLRIYILFPNKASITHEILIFMIIFIGSSLWCLTKNPHHLICGLENGISGAIMILIQSILINM